MGWLAVGAALLFGADGGVPPRATPLVIVVDAGTAAPDPPDPELLEELELLRQYELLRVYPLLAPE
jgi:hypothetical protein